MAYSSFCVDASAITKVSRLPLWARNWLVEQKDYTADLDFDNFGVSFCIVADSFLQRPFRGQIDCREPSHSHRYQFVSTYAHNDFINFYLSLFFRGLYFRGSKSVCENCENLHPAKISLYTVYKQSLICSHFPIPTPLSCPLNQLLQFSAQVEHFGAPMVSVSAPLTAVMGHDTAQMAVMRLDVVVSSD